MRGEVSAVRYLLSAIGFLLTLTEWKLRAVGCWLLMAAPSVSLRSPHSYMAPFGGR